MIRFATWSTCLWKFDLCDHQQSHWIIYHHHPRWDSLKTVSISIMQLMEPPVLAYYHAHLHLSAQPLISGSPGTCRKTVEGLSYICNQHPADIVCSTTSYLTLFDEGDVLSTLPFPCSARLVEPLPCVQPQDRHAHHHWCQGNVSSPSPHAWLPERSFHRRRNSTSLSNPLSLRDSTFRLTRISWTCCWCQGAGCHLILEIPST